MNARTLTPDEIEQALLDPAAIFACPVDVVGASGISEARKIEILRRWEYDVREQEVAQEENMAGALPITLSHVLDALNALNAGQSQKHSSPTKQGGV